MLARLVERPSDGRRQPETVPGDDGTRLSAGSRIRRQRAGPNILDGTDSNRRKLIGLGPEATPAVLILLKDKSADARAAAIAILGEIGDKSALPAGL